tara:strand:- start:12212 stop:12727 length:516 start_codon:yes stop_codon:yes gene_type:complete
MAYPINGVIGVNVADAPVTTPVWPVGARTRLSDGSEWAYLAIPTSQAITIYMACGGTTGVATVPLTSTNALTGVPIYIAQQAVSSNASSVQYMWFLCANPLGSSTYKVRVAASCAVAAKLATTANAGTLDDTTAGTVLRVDGIVLSDSQPSGSSGSRTFRTSSYPMGWGAV